jgi:hypothetical protein
MQSFPARLFSRQALLLSLSLFLSIGTGVSLLEARVRLPSWLTEVTAQPIPSEFTEADAVVLLDLMERTYDQQGSYEDRFLWVVKIQTTEGRDDARFAVSYNKENGRVRAFDIYILPPGGDPVQLDKDDCYRQEQSSSGQIFSESWTMGYSAADEARPGTIVAFEVRLTSSTLFADSSFLFNGTRPRLRTEVRYSVPEGWRVEGTVAENAQVEVHSSQQNNQWTWLARNVSAHPELGEDEIYDDVASGVRLRVIPNPARPPRNPLRYWNTWEEVSEYIAEIFRRQGTVTDSIRLKALELTRDKADTLAKIRAIAEFSQSINYVSVAIDLATGGGFRPHPASRTLESHWGDCKDMVNLTCALLTAAGIESYPLLVYSGYDQKIDPDWPFPGQFNHVIVAVRAEADTSWNAVVEHEEIGQLLVFDPTASTTTAGNLPYYLQGHSALLGAKTADSLLRLPIAQPEDHRIERTITGAFSAEGDLSFDVVASYHGLQSTSWRRLQREMRASDLRDGVQMWLQDSLRRVALEDFSLEEDPTHNELTLRAKCSSPGYARSLRKRLLVFQPVLIGRKDFIPEADEERTSSIRPAPSQTLDTYRLELPAGYLLDEGPSSRLIEKPFGTYSLQFTCEDGVLELTRELTWKPEVVSPEDYEDYRAFHRAVREGDHATIVLIKE